MESTYSNSKLNYSNSIKGPGMIPQILHGLSIVVLLYLSFLFIELLYSYYHKLNMNKTNKWRPASTPRVTSSHS
jgi:succinate dehydrogenase/fumarate reductase cytochrome b subunit